jgi:acetolactate synthase regulatory subunit
MDSINSRVTITLDNKKTSVEKIIDDIRKCGFKVTERIDSVAMETSEKTQKTPLNQ